MGVIETLVVVAAVVAVSFLGQKAERAIS